MTFYIIKMFEFEIKNKCKKARTGLLNTPRGKLETPNLAIVATHGHIKLLNKTEERQAKPDLTISNTFHLFVNGKVGEIKKAGGLNKWSGLKNPTMTDSGGFQIFSLGWGKAKGMGKVLKQTPANFPASENAVKISEKGAVFVFNGKKYELTPEKSMKIQQDIGADIIFAFDECTSPLHSHIYTKKSMERTHRWAIRGLKAKSSKMKDRQALFGIAQGGIFEDLRKKSSHFIGSLGFDGFGIGGSFGEKQMSKVINWSLSGLPDEKPRHLLGIGKIDDIFAAVKNGIDLFDCVVPTREARHGVLYAKTGKLNVMKGIFGKDNKLIERNCGCRVCRQGIRRNEIRELFKTDKISGQKLATIHNIQFYKNFFAEIREAIAENKLEKSEKEYGVYLN